MKQEGNWNWIAVAAIFALLLVFYAKKDVCVREILGPRQNLAERDWLNEIDVDKVRPSLVAFAEAVKDRENIHICNTVSVGYGWGVHSLCNTIPQHCTFYSFGISSDYSFDVDLAGNYSCEGFAADPTVTHPSKLHPSVTFHQIGAKMLHEDGPQSWKSTSMPNLMRWRGDEWVDVLKMDCEGCEYSLAKDVSLEDPLFFHKIGQFAIEIHVSKRWLNSTEHMYSFGKLLQQLDEAGLHLADAAIGGCASYDEAPGCMDILHEVGIPCGSGVSCHNYLFARPTTQQ